MFCHVLVRLGIPEDSIGGLLKEKRCKDGNTVWVGVSTDEDVMWLQDDDLITIVTNSTNNPWKDNHFWLSLQEHVIVPSLYIFVLVQLFNLIQCLVYF